MHEGGYIGPVDGEPIITHPNDYMIPDSFAQAWACALLDEINQGLDSPDEDGVQ